jgi:hypothetical protein
VSSTDRPPVRSWPGTDRSKGRTPSGVGIQQGSTGLVPAGRGPGQGVGREGLRSGDAVAEGGRGDLGGLGVDGLWHPVGAPPVPLQESVRDRVAQDLQSHLDRFQNTEPTRSTCPEREGRKPEAVFSTT